MKLTVTWARRTLKAVDELIGQYKDGTHRGASTCPFCKITGRIKEGKHQGDGNCRKCPWLIFRGYPCARGIAGAGNVPGLRIYSYQADPIPLRLRRLYGWRVRLKNIIAKGDIAQ